MKAAAEKRFNLPADPIQAAIILQQFLLFSNSGIIEAVAAMDQITGWFSTPSGAALYTCALLAPAEGHIVEIGSFKGRSTVVLGKALKSISSATAAKVFAIDPHIGSEEHQPGGSFAGMMPAEGSTFREFMENIARHEVIDVVVPVKKTSQEAAAEWDGSPVRLLFIDGDHSVAGCETDYLAWEQHLIPGGMILLHDVGPHFPGPVHIVEKYLSDRKKFLNVYQVDSLHIAVKQQQ